MSEPTNIRRSYRTYLAATVLIALAAVGFGFGSVVRSVQDQTGTDLYLALLSFFGPSRYEFVYKDVSPFTRDEPTPSLKSTGNTIPGADVYDRRLELMNGFYPDSRFRTWSESVGRLDLLANHWEDDTRGDDKKAKKKVLVPTIEPCTAILVTPQLLLTANHCTQHTARNSVSSDLQILQAHFWLGYFGATCGRSAEEQKNSGIPPCAKPRCLVVYPTPLERNEDLDYAVFRIQHACKGAAPDTAATLVPADLWAANTKKGDDLAVLHHPLGGVMFVTRSQCRITEDVDQESKQDPRIFKHSCGTLPGTSGAPIVNEATGKILAIHVRGDRSIDATAENVGMATPLAFVKKCTRIPALANAITVAADDAGWYSGLTLPASCGASQAPAQAPPPQS